MTGKELAASIFGQDVVDRDWPGYEHAVTLTSSDDVVGFVGLTVRSIMYWDTPISVAGIGFVCVREDFRGGGTATYLMEQAHAKARELGLDFALLNAGYPKIYERIGYHHALNLPAGWYVCELGEATWADNVPIDLKGTW